MRRFQFRLEAVLRHRELIEELREQSYMTAQGELVKQQAKLSSLKERYRETVAGRPGGAPGEQFDASSIHGRERYLEALQASIDRQMRWVEAAHIVAEEMRRALVAARQAREAVSRLQEKDLKAHQALALKLEQSALDELATLRHGMEMRNQAA